MEKWYKYDTDDIEIRDELRMYFHENNIYYELSACYNGWHFEIKADENEAEKITWFLESLFEVRETKTVTEFVGYNEDGIPCFESYEVKL